MENRTLTKQKPKSPITDSYLVFDNKRKEIEFKHYENGRISLEINESERQGIMLEKEDYQKLYS